LRNFDSGEGTAMRLHWAGPGIATQVVPLANLGHFPTLDATPNDGEVDVTGPVEDQVLRGRDLVLPITWNTTSSDPTISWMRIAYSPDAGTSWQYLTRNTADDGAEDWNIPNDVYWPHARVRVEARNAQGRVL